MIKSKLVSLSTFSDERGFLTILEKEIDFSIKEFFDLWSRWPKRGGHRHKVTRQALIAIQGKVKVNIQKKIVKKILS